jgi:type III secretory pathway component EscS
VSTVNPAARLRGTAAGLLTAALTIAAHSVGSGAAPTGAVVGVLAVLAATVGVLGATIARAADVKVLLGLLAAGQLCGHVVLSAVGHSHAAATAPPAAVMLAAHAAAVAGGALLISASDRLCRALSRAVRVVVHTVAGPVTVAAVVAIVDADQPPRWVLFLAASMSHRGPPVSHSR